MTPTPTFIQLKYQFRAIRDLRLVKTSDKEYPYAITDTPQRFSDLEWAHKFLINPDWDAWPPNVQAFKTQAQAFATGGFVSATWMTANINMSSGSTSNNLAAQLTQLQQVVNDLGKKFKALEQALHNLKLTPPTPSPPQPPSP